ncbi:Uncharacterised protein [Rhodococcus rhodochrous]|uniref:Uncharacterized protein n=1 Tax=Rhodococcus sp. NS1 TaxID=402236 RepID=Q06GC1_9NOCA|nr:hypothetical protein PNSL1.062 [Rhodococcus sp. NS1]SNV19714.1 Uncharacterised protein [Rhodococcus rhodochrous]
MTRPPASVHDAAGHAVTLAGYTAADAHTYDVRIYPTRA